MSARIGNLASGELVYDREDGSHIHAGISLDVIGSVLSGTASEGKDFFWISKHMGTPIGTNACIQTTEDDTPDIFYALRPGRTGLTRFIRNRVPEVSDILSILLERSKNNEGYVLLTAFVGNPAEAEPTDTSMDFSPEALRRSVEFWRCHALISNGVAYDTETETIEIPNVYEIISFLISEK